MKKQFFRERECIHRDEDAEGEFYNGVFYVQALGRLKVEAAMRIANKVSPFFWVDAPHILVWHFGTMVIGTAAGALIGLVLEWRASRNEN